MEMVEKAQAILEKYALCDHCLGRQFAALGYGMDNQNRGIALKTLLTMKGHELALSKDRKGVALLKTLAENGSLPMAADVLRKLKRRPKETKRCYLCEGRFEALQVLVNRIVEMLRDYEYQTFLVGVKLPREVEEREDEFKAEFEVQHGESIKNEFSRVVGKMLTEIARKPVDFMKPHVVIIANPFTEDLRLQVNPLFIMGRYRKLVRGIPQSRWFCVECRGKGCQACNWTGRMHPESVEELIARPVLERTLGEETLFHGAGREDADARMLGAGRPFIIQVKKPRKRSLDLSELERSINQRAQRKIEVKRLRLVDRDMIVSLKHVESSQKAYRLTIRFDRGISDKEIEKLEESLTEVTVVQQTPKRVLRRRADRAREKHIYETRVKRISPNSIEMLIRCQGGLYVKELVTGDDGRTEPNVSKIADAKAEPVKLDVLSISFNRGRS